MTSQTITPATGLTKRSERTLNSLKEKSTNWERRMPSLSNIHLLLEELGLKHSFRESTNVVEYRSAGNRYVNDRHDGKSGFCLTINVNDGRERDAVGTSTIELNTADSYYSYNTGNYANELVKYIEFKTTKEEVVTPRMPERQKAMQWWNQQTLPIKVALAEKYYPTRTPQSLTGREIETVWALDTGRTPKPSEVPFYRSVIITGTEGMVKALSRKIDNAPFLATFKGVERPMHGWEVMYVSYKSDTNIDIEWKEFEEFIGHLLTRKYMIDFTWL